MTPKLVAGVLTCVAGLTAEDGPAGKAPDSQLPTIGFGAAE